MDSAPTCERERNSSWTGLRRRPSGGERRRGYGVTLISEILPVPGASLAGEIPADFMPPTVMHAFEVSGAHNPETAKKFLAFLQSPEARKMIEAKV